jgi:hypothetical protein
MHLNMLSELRNNFKVVFTSPATGFFRFYIWRFFPEDDGRPLTRKSEGAVLYIYIPHCKFLALKYPSEIIFIFLLVASQ